MQEPTIIYEDENIAVLDKPSGLAVHADGRSNEATLADWVLARYPQTKEVGEPLTLSDGRVLVRPGIVHRLDRETSGVMVVAKTIEAHEHLKRSFQERLVTKEYRALTYGAPKEERGIIDKPIGRSPRDFRRFSAQPGARGTLREAATRYDVLAVAEGVGYVVLFPKTGRTHQIRVHLKAIHHPVLCDRLYAPGQPCLLGFERLALHAHRLTISVPGGEERTFEAPLPDDFVAALSHFPDELDIAR